MRLLARCCCLLLPLFLTPVVRADSEWKAIQIVVGPQADEIERRYVALLQDRLGEMTSAPVALGVAAPGFEGLVIHVGTLASYPEVQKLARQMAVPIPSELDPGPEGFILASRKSHQQSTVLALGADRRGVIYCIGELLRQAEGNGGAIRFPDKLHLRQAPRWPVRGLLVSQGATICELTGARHWTRDETRRAYLNYILAGANTFELGAGGGPDQLFDFLKSYDIDLLTCIVANQGRGPKEWQAKEAIGRNGYLSPGIPEARAAILQQHEDLFRRMPHFDYVHFKSGDGGGDESEISAPYGKTLIHLCEDLTGLLRKYHPKTKVFVGNQKLDNAGDRAIFEYLQEKPRDWIDGIIFGPGSNAMGWTPGRRQDHRTDLFRYARRGAAGGYLREMLHQLPPKQSILLFTDITHWVYSQWGLMDHEMIPDRNYQTPPQWDYDMYAHKPDPAMAQVYNRRTFHARPSAYYHAFQETAEFTIGDVAYSEGHFDHVNAWTYLRLFWNPHQSVQQLVNEFARAHFGSAAGPQMAEAIFTLEKNHETPIADNPGIDQLIQQVQIAGRLMPESIKSRSYLWRQFLEKAYLDKYIQLDLQQQNQTVDQIVTTLKAGFHGGHLDQVVAKYADVRLPEPTAAMEELKKSADQLGQESDRLYGVRNDGYFNLKQDYVGFGWLSKQLKKAAAGSSETRRSIVERILYNDDPGVGGFYDDAGDPARSPHLTRGWSYDGGEISTENRRSQKSMVYTTDETNGVTFEYEGLDPKAEYRVRFSLVRPGYKPRYAERHKQTSQSIYADEFPLVKDLVLPEFQAEDFEYDVPAAATADGRLTIQMRKQPGIGEGLQSDITVWRNTGGWGTLCSEVWLMKKGAPRNYQVDLKTGVKP